MRLVFALFCFTFEPLSGMITGGLARSVTDRADRVIPWYRCDQGNIWKVYNCLPWQLVGPYKNKAKGQPHHLEKAAAEEGKDYVCLPNSEVHIEISFSALRPIP